MLRSPQVMPKMNRSSLSALLEKEEKCCDRDLEESQDLDGDDEKRKKNVVADGEKRKKIDVMTEGKAQSEWKEEIGSLIETACKEHILKFNRKQLKMQRLVQEDDEEKMRRNITKRIRMHMMEDSSRMLVRMVSEKLKEFFWFFICGVSPEIDEKYHLPPPCSLLSERKEEEDIAVMNSLESSSAAPSPSLLRKILISPFFIKEFVDIAKPNLECNLETGAVLAGQLIDGKYHVTALLVPLQICKSDSYEALNEGDLHKHCQKNSLIHIGSIHTHPVQKCYLSSVDLHNHFWFQNELLEAISIVVAPTDSRKRFGMFRITDPGGMSVLRTCSEKQTSFHPHDNPSDGSPIYSDCSDNVIFDPQIRYSVIDFHSNEIL